MSAYKDNIPGGFNCGSCGTHVEHGRTHRVLMNTKQCVTEEVGKDDFYHEWIQPQPGRKVQHIACGMIHGEPTRFDGWGILETAAQDLVGSGRLVSMKREENEDYTTVEFAMKREKA